MNTSTVLDSVSDMSDDSVDDSPKNTCGRNKIEIADRSLKSFSLMGERQFLLKTFTFKEFKKFFEICVYDDETGEGEQRAPVESHVKKIQSAMMDNEYTPTVFTVSVPSEFIHNNTIHFDKLPLTDGGHRFLAICRIYEKEPGLRHTIDKLSMPTMMLIDSDTKKDFVNLQKGRPADPTQILSMSIRANSFMDAQQKQYEFCRDLARLLNTTKGSPFSGHIRLDSRTTGGVKGAALIKVDSSVLTLGGAHKICAELKITAKQYVEWAVQTYNQIKHTQAFTKGNFLHGDGVNCPFSMLVALMNIGVFCKHHGYSPNWEYGLAVLAIPKERTFVGNRRQSLLFDVCVNLFEEVDCVKEQDVPEDLLNIFGHKSFSLKKLKKNAIGFDAFMEANTID